MKEEIQSEIKLSEKKKITNRHSGIRRLAGQTDHHWLPILN